MDEDISRCRDLTAMAFVFSIRMRLTMLRAKNLLMLMLLCDGKCASRRIWNHFRGTVRELDQLRSNIDVWC